VTIPHVGIATKYPTVAKQQMSAASVGARLQTPVSALPINAIIWMNAVCAMVMMSHAKIVMGLSMVQPKLMSAVSAVVIK
jgi:hypothetical protein